MRKRLALVLLYEKENRYSFNALVGALETYDYFADLPIFFINSTTAHSLTSAFSSGARCKHGDFSVEST